MSPLSKDETRRDGSFAFIISHYTVIKTVFMFFVYSSLGREDGCRLAVRMVADVTETRYVIPSLEFKT